MSLVTSGRAVAAEFRQKTPAGTCLRIVVDRFADGLTSGDPGPRFSQYRRALVAMLNIGHMAGTVVLAI